MGVKEDLQEVLNYLSEAEQTHFEECEKEEQDNHIYKKVLSVIDWLNSPFCPLVDEDEI